MNLKKPKFWDYKKPNIYAYLLYPLAILIKFLSYLKKDTKQRVEIKTICVGNIYLGGTGKTSLCIKINKILQRNKIKSCFIKKFYTNQIDEIKLLEKNGKIFSSSKRIDALKQAENENYEVAILDDGLQDKSIKYDLKFVCFNNINWVGNGMTIPAGPLREEIKELKNYDHIFLNGNLEDTEKLKKQILEINSHTTIHLGKYKPLNINEFDKNENYYVFSGIGNYQTLISMLKNNGIKIIKDKEFPDHHKYRDEDINKIINEAENLNCKIITTEKDSSKLKETYLNKIKIIKSELNIVDEEQFIKTIL